MKDKLIRVILLLIVVLMVSAFTYSSSPMTSPILDDDDDMEDMTIIMLKGTVTSLVSEDFSSWPEISITVTGTTSEGSVAIKSIAKNFFTDFYFGENPSGDQSEHIETTHIWDFGRGNEIYTDATVFNSPILITEDCDGYTPQEWREIITSGTGKFADAKGYLTVDIDPFCFFDERPVPLTGQIAGLLVLPEIDDDD